MRIRTVGVLGAGTMGAGIAQVCAQADCDVRLYDVSKEAVAKGVKRISDFLGKGVGKGKVTAADRDAALARIRSVTAVSEGASGADLVIEAAPEDLELKRKLFREVAQVAPKGAILATNTSSLPITRIAEDNDAAPRIVGMHFFNPVPLMKLLELVVGEKTAPATVEAVREFGVRLGKEVITVRDRPGFASSRLGIAIAMEAIRMVEEGVASPEDIDKAMVHGYGHPMGPLRLTDVVGCDIRLAIADHLAEALKAQHFKPPQLLRKMVAEGKLGKKSGRGFYEWKE
ncbi:MAG TPA: 3-hydroxyacyl-CoA dehydrogenase family protein [Planctomycetota bacterium]|nr:3-hydroxyacyl-CoA dehydrogenase family protein [Planctomycetota bacterium]